MAEPTEGKVVLLEYDPPKPAVVQDLLSVQFTATYDDGTDTLTYLFYADEGDTWMNLQDYLHKIA